MTATFRQASDEILAVFQAAWGPLGHTALYDSVAGAQPPATEPWARVSVRHSTGEQATLSGGLGTRRYSRDGTLFVQIFAPVGNGLSVAYDLAKVVADAYEGTATPAGVWFRDVRLNEIGPDDQWFNVNVLVDFTYDEVK